METILNSRDLILSLSGELLVDPALLVETIGGDETLRHLIKSYAAGGLSYRMLRQELGDYF